MTDDPYATLGVTKGATDEDIRRAFRRLAKELHPDLNPKNRARTEERFKKVSSAYELLSDPKKRKAFDRGEIDASGEPRRDGFRGYAGGHTRGARASARAGFDDFDVSDIFSDIFGGTRYRRPGARGGVNVKGPDVRYTLELDFLEAVAGAKKRVTLPEGGVLDLSIPAGVSDGQILRLKGKGAAGVGTAERGDALVEVRVRPHAHFQRDEDDILLEVPITIDEAVLGAKIEVPTIAGRVQLTIPKGTNSGRVFRLRGKGIRSAGRSESGDQLVTVRIVLPDKIDDSLAYFFSEWRQKNGYDPGRN